MLRSVAGVPVATVLALTLVWPADVDAKTPGASYCFGGWCHRVSTIGETDSIVGRGGFLTASYYDDCSRDRLNPCGLTSSGAVFKADEPDNAASPIFPDGTVILAYNPASRQAAVLRVTSAGPYHGSRKLDVSRGAAERLGFIKQGVAELAVAVLSSPNADEARYRERRVYPKVPGPIGTYANFDAAHEAALARLRITASAVASLAAEPPQESAQALAAERVTPAAADPGATVHAAIPPREMITAATDEADASVTGMRLQVDVGVLRIDAPRVRQLVAIAQAKARLRVADSAGTEPLPEAAQTWPQWAAGLIAGARARARLARPAAADERVAGLSSGFPNSLD